jgi:hypothetical protein
MALVEHEMPRTPAEAVIAELPRHGDGGGHGGGGAASYLA